MYLKFNIYSKRFLIWLICFCVFIGMVSVLFIKSQEKTTELSLKEVSFDDLKGWNNQDFIKLKDTFVKNCNQLTLFYKNKAFDEKFGNLEQWQRYCNGLKDVKNNRESIKKYFETLKVVRVRRSVFDNSLFTGYYSPILKGSYKKGGKYKYPLYKKPDDLVSGNLSEFFPYIEEFKFKKIFAKIDLKNARIKPYYNRKQIEEDGVLADKDAMVWVDDKIDAFFLQIQGSGKVVLDDGKVIHVGYSSQNGRPYYAIGGELIKNGWATEEEMSLQTIRQFLLKNPKLQDKILQKNQSYVFFEEKKDGPYGAFGMVLSDNHSVAVDRNYIPLGIPLFIETKLTADEKDFNNMVFAQDVGGAIVGEIRADIYFGEGKKSEIYSGKQKSTGNMYVFSAENL